LRKGLPDLVRRLARIDGLDDLALTTNGSLLASHAQALRDAGLHRITVSLDALSPGTFPAMSGGRGRIDDGALRASLPRRPRASRRSSSTASCSAA
jgi:cyclic pyranopterin phosphate synthase